MLAFCFNEELLLLIKTSSINSPHHDWHYHFLLNLLLTVLDELNRALAQVSAEMKSVKPRLKGMKILQWLNPGPCNTISARGPPLIKPSCMSPSQSRCLDTAWHIAGILGEGVTFQVPQRSGLVLVGRAPLKSMFCVVWAVREQVSIYKDNSTICPGTAHLSAEKKHTRTRRSEECVSPPVNHCEGNSSSCVALWWDIKWSLPTLTVR